MSTDKNYRQQKEAEQATKDGEAAADAAFGDFGKRLTPMPSSTAHNDDARDASRWRKFNKVAKRHWNYDKGAITFYLPRNGAGFKPLEKTLDEDYEPVACVPSASGTLSRTELQQLIEWLKDGRVSDAIDHFEEQLRAQFDIKNEGQK